MMLEETPQATSTAPSGQVRTAVRKLRQERRPAAPVLLTVLPAALALRGSGPAARVLAEYPRERVVYAGSGSDADRRYFGLVTSAETGGLAASHSCHVFAVDPRFAEHDAHAARARDFQITCTSDPVAERCLEFPPSAEYVVGVIRGMYSLPPDDYNSPTLAQLSRLAAKSDSPGVGELCRANRAVFRIPRRAQRFEARVDGPVAVANSPQPSNHSEMTTTSSNSDSGIGFHNDCRNIADRILVVDFAQPPPVNRFRREMPRRPVGLVGCSSFEADGSFLSNTTPVVDGFGGLGRPLNLDDVILNSNDLQRHVSPRKDEDTYNYNNNVPSPCVMNGALYDQVYSESEGHDYELLQQDSVGCDEQSQKTDCQSNESVHTMISEGTSKESLYTSRSHDDTRPPPRRRHLQASLDDMLVLGLREPPPSADSGDGTFVHPASIKCKDRDREKREAPRRAVSPGPGETLPAAASEPDLRNSKSEPSSPFRRWTTGNGAVSSQSLHSQSITSSTAAQNGSGFTCPVPLWSLGLEHLLSDPIGSAAFAQFLAKEFAHENIRFWWSCEQYAVCTPHERRIELAEDIWQTFLAEGASDPVNVDAAAKRSTLLQLHQTPLPDDLFLQAQNQIFNVMKFDSYPRFLRSEIHADCARADMRGQPPPPALSQAASTSRAGVPADSTPPPPRTPLPSPLPTPPPHAARTPSGSKTSKSKLKKSASNASERRRSGGVSLIPWRRTGSRDRAAPPPPPPMVVYDISEPLDDDDQDIIIDVVKQNAPKASLCRVVMPDGATSVLEVEESLTVRSLVDRVLHRRNLRKAYGVILKDPKEMGGENSHQFRTQRSAMILLTKAYWSVSSTALAVLAGVLPADLKGETVDVDSSQSSTVLGGREVFVERRVEMNLELRGHLILLRIRGPRALGPVIRQLACKYAPDLTEPVVLVSNRILPLDTNIEELDDRPVVVAELSETGEYVRPPRDELEPDTLSERAFVMLGPHAVPARSSSCRGSLRAPSSRVPNLANDPIMVIDKAPDPSSDSNPEAVPTRGSNPLAGPSRGSDALGVSIRTSNPSTINVHEVVGPRNIIEPIAGPSRVINPVAGPSRATGPIAGPSRVINPVAGPRRALEHVLVHGPYTALEPIAGPSWAPDPVSGPSNYHVPPSSGVGSVGRVRAAVRAGPPVHQHPPEFLENLRQTQCQRAKSKNEPSSSRAPPPLPPKPSRTPAIV